MSDYLPEVFNLNAFRAEIQKKVDVSLIPIRNEVNMMWDALNRMRDTLKVLEEKIKDLENARIS